MALDFQIKLGLKNGGFWEDEIIKTRFMEKSLPVQQRESRPNLTHTLRSVRESNQGHIGGIKCSRHCAIRVPRGWQWNVWWDATVKKVSRRFLRPYSVKGLIRYVFGITAYTFQCFETRVLRNNPTIFCVTLLISSYHTCPKWAKGNCSNARKRSWKSEEYSNNLCHLPWQM